MVFEGLARPVVVGPALLFLGYVVYVAFLKKPHVPVGLPWLGWKPGMLAQFRASIQGVLRNHEILEEGYYQVSRATDRMHRGLAELPSTRLRAKHSCLPTS